MPNTFTIRAMRSIAQLCLQRGQDRKSGHTGGKLSLLEGQITSDLSVDDLVNTERAVASDVDEVTLNHAPQVVAGGWKNRRENDFESASRCFITVGP